MQILAKVTRVFVNNNFGAKMIILSKKMENLCDFFSHYSLHYYWICMFLEKYDFFWRTIYISNVSNSDKNFSSSWEILFCACVSFHSNISFTGQLLFGLKLSFCAMIFWAKVSVIQLSILIKRDNFFWKCYFFVMCASLK